MTSEDSKNGSSSLEELFKDRYTDRDPDYERAESSGFGDPPVIFPWYGRPKRNFDYSQANRKRRYEGENDRDDFHNRRRDGYGDGGGGRRWGNEGNRGRGGWGSRQQYSEPRYPRDDRRDNYVSYPGVRPEGGGGNSRDGSRDGSRDRYAHPSQRSSSSSNSDRSYESRRY